MLRNLFLTAVRSLAKNKFFSFLNVLGLSIGIAVFLLISLYVTFERSYENFIPDKENIYRVGLTSYVNGEPVFSSAENYPGVGPALKKELPEIVSFARLYNMGYKNNVIITNEDAKPDPIAIKHRRFLYADSSFLAMMGYPMVSGEARTALAQPFNAVISEKYARLYFGNTDAVGKSLRLQDDDGNNELVKVTGVFRDLPANTHLKFDVLFSYKTLLGRFGEAPFRYDQSWQRKDMYTFVKVQNGTDPGILESKFASIVNQYSPWLKEKNQRDVLFLQPLADIHLKSNLAEEAEPNGDNRIVLFMGIIGILVLVIAWINYVNLSTAKALERAKEVGVRKVMGAFRRQLIQQFLTEAALINLVSMIVAVTIVVVALPAFNSLTGHQFKVTDLAKIEVVALVIFLWIGGTLLSGAYPALVLASFKPVIVLKGKLKNSSGGILLRKSLVVLQFAASIGLIAVTIIVYRQLNFMMNRDIGMNIDEVMVVERPGISSRERDAFNSSIDVFRNEVAKSPAVKGLAASITVPGKQREYKVMVKPYGRSEDQLVSVRFNSMDFDFINVFGMKLIAGRAFSESFAQDPDTSVIITESASRLLGYKKPEDALGQTLAIPQYQWSAIVVGVVNDYHQVSLKKTMDPTIFYCTKYGGEFYSMKIVTSDLEQSVAHIKSSWEKAFPGNPFEYFFLDEFFNKQYENEKKFGKLFTTFSALAVIVGCLGLFGLSAYTAIQRTKEIGIRKALGSTSRSIFILLSKEYAKLVLLSAIVISPIVWYVMQQWIEAFPYRVNISGDIFLIAAMAVLLIATLTVSFQTLRAARTNPVDSLRYE
jgi:putative ABC transport system permease protein